MIAACFSMTNEAAKALSSCITLSWKSPCHLHWRMSSFCTTITVGFGLICVSYSCIPLFFNQNIKHHLSLLEAYSWFKPLLHQAPRKGKHLFYCSSCWSLICSSMADANIKRCIKRRMWRSWSYRRGGTQQNGKNTMSWSHELHLGLLSCKPCPHQTSSQFSTLGRVIIRLTASSWNFLLSPKRVVKSWFSFIEVSFFF